MKPEHIFLVRHGESFGNVDKKLLADVPDWKISITENGIRQAASAASSLSVKIKDSPIIYSSPLYRARETAKIIRQKFAKAPYIEDPRLREHDWGNFQESEALKKIDAEGEKYGKFFYRPPNGKSCADVYNRVATFLESLHRDFEKATFPQNLIIVSHGRTIRVFLMKWLHWTVEKFDMYANPENGSIVEMKYSHLSDTYVLVTRLKKKGQKSRGLY